GCRCFGAQGVTEAIGGDQAAILRKNRLLGMTLLVRLRGKRPGGEAQTIGIFAQPSLDTESRKLADFVELPSAGPTLGFDQCLRMGMARMNRQGGGKLQGARVQRRPIAQGGASEREGAGLVEDDGI